MESEKPVSGNTKVLKVAEEAEILNSRAPEEPQQPKLDRESITTAGKVPAVAQDVYDYNAQFKVKSIGESTQPNPTLSTDDIPHIFDERTGHLPDTQYNRSLLLELTADLSNYFECQDSRGNMWCEKILDDGTQLWAQVRNGKIRNGGLNLSPKKWDPETGLSRNIKK